jgi:hypothetical protein
LTGSRQKPPDSLDSPQKLRAAATLSLGWLE